MLRMLAPLLLLAGCAAPFTEVKGSSALDGVWVKLCGVSNANPGSVMRTMEPPVGAPEERIEPPKELNVCLRVVNKGSRPVRLDRADVQLKHPRERRDWAPDTLDQAATVAPGQSRDFQVGFTYSPIEPGEEVQVLLERALTISGKPLRVDPIVLRRK